MSFAKTTAQIRNRSKTVTRRLGWRCLTPGTRLRAVEKCMGLKKGEGYVDLGVIEVVSVRREHLHEITRTDCIREGFPELTPAQFVAMFIREMHLPGGDWAHLTVVNRIEFRYVDDQGDGGKDGEL